MPNPDRTVDVVVVGAGFAGLSAARALVRHGHDVAVCEGRDRVGGRSHTAAVAGVRVDLGATFVGPTQDAVLSLAAELGIPTVATFCDGANLIRWRGATHSYRGTIPTLSPAALLDIARVRWQFGRIARSVPLAEPWDAPRALRLDAVSLGAWLRSVHATRTTRDLLAIAARVSWGCEPDDVSLLHAARYVAAAGGWDRLLDVRGGAQQDRFAGGTQQLAEAVAAELGPRVQLACPVSRIDWAQDTVAVTSARGVVHAHYAILAIPPAHRSAITFTPALPEGYDQLARHWPQGRLGKAYAAYETPFWRADGYSDATLSDQGPVFITFDVSPHDDGPGILLGFVDARAVEDKPAEQRRADALSCFAALFGDRARHPVDYTDYCWGTEDFAPGGPTAAVPPVSWTRYGRHLRRPVGPIHWAGTETAQEWTGFLDGAVRSGQRAAAEVTARL